MGWRPIHEAHSIDRVRVLLEFDSPLPEKPLARAARPTVDRANDLGFRHIEQAASSVHELHVMLGGVGNLSPVTAVPPAQNGVILKRLEGKKLAEEVGFRDTVFGYFSTEYSRWENLRSRFWDIFEIPLNDALNSVDVAKMKLEYWDRFVFRGNPAEADASSLISQIDPSVPASAISGEMLWHSHVGWLEPRNDHLVLVNRNIDAIDIPKADGVQERHINIYSLLELRWKNKPSASGAQLKDELDYLHERSVSVFGETITPASRENIGLNLDSQK